MKHEREKNGNGIGKSNPPIRRAHKLFHFMTKQSFSLLHLMIHRILCPFAVQSVGRALLAKRTRKANEGFDFFFVFYCCRFVIDDDAFGLDQQSDTIIRTRGNTTRTNGRHTHTCVTNWLWFMRWLLPHQKWFASWSKKGYTSIGHLVWPDNRKCQTTIHLFDNWFLPSTLDIGLDSPQNLAKHIRLRDSHGRRDKRMFIFRYTSTHPLKMKQ